MGSLFGSSWLRSAAGNTIWTPPVRTMPTPTPDNFKLLSVERCDKLWVSKIEYPGCPNFEGCKVLVTEYNPRERAVIDPHFLEGSGLLARFEPTVRGYSWAKEFAYNASEDYP